MQAETKSYEGLVHAGAGTGLFLVQLCALIPGLLPALALVGLIAAVFVVPLLVTGLAAALLLAPFYGLWRLATGERRRRASLNLRSASAHRAGAGPGAQLASMQKGAGSHGAL